MITRTCERCRPTWILCVCGYEETGKRRIRPQLPAEKLTPAARRFRDLRGILGDLTPAARRYTTKLIRLAEALWVGVKQEHSDAAEAIWAMIRTRHETRGTLGWAERCFRDIYLAEWIAAKERQAAEDAKPKPDPRPGHYYVTASDKLDGATKWWPLCGPFPTHQQALDVVDEVRAYAQAVDPRAHFYSFDTRRDDHPLPLKCPITMPMLEAFRAARNAPPPPKKPPAPKRKVIGSAA